MTRIAFARQALSIFGAISVPVFAVSGMGLLSLLSATTMPLSLRAQQPTSLSTLHIRMVTVEKNVNLEVIDWGGTGRPLVLHQGLGGVAQDYDTFAPQFTTHYHVYELRAEVSAIQVSLPRRPQTIQPSGWAKIF
jgi:hypothetical protein